MVERIYSKRGEKIYRVVPINANKCKLEYQKRNNGKIVRLDVGEKARYGSIEDEIRKIGFWYKLYSTGEIYVFEDFFDKCKKFGFKIIIKKPSWREYNFMN